MNVVRCTIELALENVENVRPPFACVNVRCVEVYRRWHALNS